jgi:hypothetical protein
MMLDERAFACLPRARDDDHPHGAERLFQQRGGGSGQNEHADNLTNDGGLSNTVC